MSGCGNHQCQCRLENDSAFGRGRGAKVSTRSCGHQSAGTSRVRQERISPRPLPVAGCIRLWLLYPIVARLQPHEQQFLCQKKGVYWPKLSRSDMSGARVCERAAGKDAAKPLRRDRLSAMNGPQAVHRQWRRSCLYLRRASPSALRLPPGSGRAEADRRHFAGQSAPIPGSSGSPRVAALPPQQAIRKPMLPQTIAWPHPKLLGNMPGANFLRRSLWQSQQRRRHGHPGKRSGDELTG